MYHNNLRSLKSKLLWFEKLRQKVVTYVRLWIRVGTIYTYTIFDSYVRMMNSLLMKFGIQSSGLLIHGVMMCGWDMIINKVF